MENKANPNHQHQPIHQESHGPNSPNIVGNHNQITNLWVNQARRLTEDQKSALAQRMSVFSGVDGSRLLWAMMGNGESIAFAGDFADSFRWAGWDLSGFCQGLFTPPVMGLRFQFHSDEDKPMVATTLISWLASCGIKSTYETNPVVPQGQFRLLVGNKE